MNSSRSGASGSAASSAAACSRLRESIRLQRSRGLGSVSMSVPESAVLAPPAGGRERAIAMSRWRLVALLGALSMFAPLCTDMYLPALPTMTHSLHASASALQLTLTSNMLGLGGGQLLFGPLSDAYGRRAPVLAGLVVYVASSVGCALCNDVWTL